MEGAAASLLDSTDCVCYTKPPDVKGKCLKEGIPFLIHTKTPQENSHRAFPGSEEQPTLVPAMAEEEGQLVMEGLSGLLLWPWGGPQGFSYNAHIVACP